ncbi:tyrosine-type recombinase/integrase [Escherichia coli]|nr:tyrosine-type recombinase/integrase [Escherichia coli]
MFPGQCGNTAFFFKSQPDQFHFEFRGIVFPGKSFFSAHEVSTCKISGCLSYRILDSGPDGTQTTLTEALGDSQDVSLHSLRHWLATRMKERGVNLVDAQGILGHSSQSITYDLYGKGHAVQRLAEVLKTALL